MILSVVTYPDRRLKVVSKAVEKFDEKLHFLLDNMYETMMASNGIGLAAIQVDRPIQVLILNLPNEEENQDKSDLLEIINPKMTESNGTVFYQEGCLSVPGFYEDIERLETITIRYQDRYGMTHNMSAEALLSIAIQHEMEHLQGKLFIENLSYSRRKKFEKEYKKTMKEKKKR